MTAKITDGAVGSAAASAPFWLPMLEEYSAAIVAVGGVILITIRVAIAIREWRKG